MPGPVQGTGQHPLTSQLVTAGGLIRALVSPTTIAAPAAGRIVSQQPPAATSGLVIDTSQSPVVGGHQVNPISVPLVGLPANCRIVLICLADADNGNAAETLSIGSTGGLTWTTNVQRTGSSGAVAAIFSAPCPAGGSLTPTVVDSDAFTDPSSEIAAIPVIFTDLNGGIPGTGATASASSGPAVTTTVDNSWVVGGGLGFGAGSTGGGQTAFFTSSGFDGGDTINGTKRDAVTPTAGTVVTMTVGVISTVAVEITPGTVGGTTWTTTATLAGTGTLTAGVIQEQMTAATLAATGTLTAGAVRTELATASSLAGTGTLTATVITVRVASTTLAGVGTLLAGILLTARAAATLAGTGALAAGADAQPAFAPILVGVDGASSGTGNTDGRTQAPSTDGGSTAAGNVGGPTTGASSDGTATLTGGM